MQSPADLSDHPRAPFEEGFVRLVECTQDRLLMLAFRITRNRDGASDFVNESYLRLWEALRSGKEVPCPIGWLVTTVRRLAIDACRRRARRPIAGADPAAVADPKSDPAAVANRLHLQELLDAAARGRPGPRRVELFRRIKGDGVRAREAAREFGVSVRQAYLAVEMVQQFLRRRFQPC